MPTLAELRATDCIGLPRFDIQRAAAMVRYVRDKKLLECDPPKCEGRGIVIAGGGKYLEWAVVLCRYLRQVQKTQLPIQVWFLGLPEMPPNAKAYLETLEVECIDTYQVMKRHPAREMGGWHLKSYAVRHCPFEHVMFLDADCHCVMKPEDIFDLPQVKELGSLFCHDVGKHHETQWGYCYFGIPPLENEWETGQFIWHKMRAWNSLVWTCWASEHADVFYRLFHGDKGVIEACVRSSGDPFAMASESHWKGFGIEHCISENPTWRHTMATKRREFPMFGWMKRIFGEVESMRLRA